MRQTMTPLWPLKKYFMLFASLAALATISSKSASGRDVKKLDTILEEELSVISLYGKKMFRPHPRLLEKKYRTKQFLDIIEERRKGKDTPKFPLLLKANTPLYDLKSGESFLVEAEKEVMAFAPAIDEEWILLTGSNYLVKIEDVTTLHEALDALAIRPQEQEVYKSAHKWKNRMVDHEAEIKSYLQLGFVSSSANLYRDYSSNSSFRSFGPYGEFATFFSNKDLKDMKFGLGFLGELTQVYNGKGQRLNHKACSMGILMELPPVELLKITFYTRLSAYQSLLYKAEDSSATEINRLSSMLFKMGIYTHLVDSLNFHGEIFHRTYSNSTNSKMFNNKESLNNREVGFMVGVGFALF